MGFPPQGTAVVTPITSQEIWDYTTRVLTSMAPLTIPRARSGEFEVGFPITPASETVPGPFGDTDLTEVTLTPSIPADATLVSANLIAMITAMEDSGGPAPGAQEIDLEVQVRRTTVPPVAWNSVFDQNDVVGLVNNLSATVAWAGAMDVGAYVNEMGVQYDFTFTVGGGLDDIRFTQGFVLIVKYRMD